VYLAIIITMMLAKLRLLCQRCNFIVQATISLIVSYNRNTFIAQATDQLCLSMKVLKSKNKVIENMFNIKQSVN
jgi:hypothetical protein